MAISGISGDISELFLIELHYYQGYYLEDGHFRLAGPYVAFLKSLFFDPGESGIRMMAELELDHKKLHEMPAFFQLYETHIPKVQYVESVDFMCPPAKHFWTVPSRQVHGPGSPGRFSKILWLIDT